MNDEACSATTAALCGAILITHEEILKTGVSNKKAYTFTKAILIDSMVKMINLFEQEAIT